MAGACCVEEAGSAGCCADGDAEALQRGGPAGLARYLWARQETRRALSGAAVALLVLVASWAPALPAGFSETAWSLALLYSLWPVARKGWAARRGEGAITVHLLMSIAALGALAIGEFLEGLTVITLFALGEALEGYTMGRTRAGLRSLLQLAPPQALRLGDGGQVWVPVAALEVGERILVRAGDRIPLDCEVLEGSSDINQAPVTGESRPRPVGPGDEVYAGTLNGVGGLVLRVRRKAEDSTIQRIIRLVEEAQAARAPAWRLIDRFARAYTPLVAGLALLVAVVPPLLSGQPLLNEGGEPGWLYRGLALLVIACPCALLISTPVTIIAAINAAAKNGVLIKGGVHLEMLGRIRTVAFDKTGTLTRGVPDVTGLYSLECAEREERSCAACEDVLALAAAVERGSSHPFARGIRADAEARDLAGRYATATQVRALAGRGVQGYVDERLVTLGSHALFEQEHPHPEALCRRVEAAEARGETAVLLSDGERVRGYISLADQPRAQARESIAQLHALGLRTVMLSGDNAQAARDIGERLGLGDIRAGLLPEDKLRALRGLQAPGHPVAMVGDGINDTPALRAAALGVAPGGAGSAQAVEHADVVLMGDELAQLPFAIRLGRRALRTIRQNIAFSLTMKAAFLALAVSGGASLWAAIFADVGMTLLVTLNGMRLLRAR